MDGNFLRLNGLPMPTLLVVFLGVEAKLHLLLSIDPARGSDLTAKLGVHRLGLDKLSGRAKIRQISGYFAR